MLTLHADVIIRSSDESWEIEAAVSRMIFSAKSLSDCHV